jgi:hypothetical protein
MTTEVEDQLRAGMERFTAQVRVPPGLARKAYRRRQKRRIAVRTATATGAAAAVAGMAVAVPAVTGGTGAGTSGPGVLPHARTAAYVVSRVGAALAARGPGDVERAQMAVSASRQSLLTVSWGYGVSTAPGSRWRVTQVNGWSYGSRNRLTAYTAAGRAVADEAVTPAAAMTRKVEVIYPAGVWYRREIRAAGPGQGLPCTGSGPFAGFQAAGWTEIIRSTLACGQFKITGRGQINGTDAIKIAATWSHAVGTDTLWIDPSTYLPIRVAFATEPGFSAQTDIQWLPATPRNLAHLNVPIPAGFRQVSPPALP